MGFPSAGLEFSWSWQRCLRNEGIPASSPDGSHSLPLTPRFCRELSLSTAPSITPMHSGLWLSGGGCGFPATAYFGAVGFRCHPRDLAFDSHSLSLPRGAVPPAVASCVHHTWEKLQRLTGCNIPLPLSLLTSAILNLSLPCSCSQGGFLWAAATTVRTVLWLGGELGVLLSRLFFLLFPLSRCH